MWSYCLYGVLLVQTYMYTEKFPNDRRGLKILVSVMFFFETLFTVLMTIAAWSMFGTGWGDPNTLLQFNWTIGVLPLLSGIHSGLAQGFYIWRIWHLTKQLWLPVPIALCMFTQLCGLYWFAIKFNIARWRVVALPPLSGGVTVWMIGSVACDVLITLALTGILWRLKRRTKFAETSGILNRLIRISIETGSLTSVTAIVEISLWLSWERFYYYFVPFLILGKLYSNVLMATLNCRNPIFHGSSQGFVDATTSVNQATLQPAFWCEPMERGRAPGATHVAAARVSRNNIYVGYSPDSIVMTSFASAPHQEIERGSSKIGEYGAEPTATTRHFA
ncbi:putative Transmembrane protein [Mycena sanguinolenta]|uniref:Putative Transmembrane protein n=1 Tax=Mycena sanguinolenta TaxID=230812 RepID=A0A8H6ZFT8_9AGAR|nr:putative Transmembrane protein [Mycena sanguinolenta]